MTEERRLARREKLKELRAKKKANLTFNGKEVQLQIDPDVDRVVREQQM